MATSGENLDTTRFEGLFKRPSINGMLDLDWQEFQQFVAYVFSCAGYVVQPAPPKSNYHMSLVLYSARDGTEPVARVEVRRYRDAHIIRGAVLMFLGALQIAGSAPGYIVTTSEFTGPAYEAAGASGGKVRLMNGSKLLRYVSYVGGSHLSGALADNGAAQKPISPTCLFEADELIKGIRNLPRQGKIVAVGNNKGGVAKTTTALNLGFALTRKRRGKPTPRVLLVDMDGQTSLTKSLPAPGPTKGTPPVDDTVTLADYFQGRKTLADIIRQTRFPNLFVIPASQDLLKLDTGGLGRPEAELRFVEDVCQLTAVSAGGTPAFDWIILDTPPAQSFYTRSALAAADHVLMPALAETYAVIGINGLLGTARTMGALMGNADSWRDKILGCLIGRWSPNATAQGALVNLRDGLAAQGLKLFALRIPEDYRVERANRDTVKGTLRNVFKIGTQPGPAARAYERFSKELLPHANSYSAKTKRG